MIYRYYKIFCSFLRFSPVETPVPAFSFSSTLPKPAVSSSSSVSAASLPSTKLPAGLGKEVQSSCTVLVTLIYYFCQVVVKSENQYSWHWISYCYKNSSFFCPSAPCSDQHTYQYCAETCSCCTNSCPSSTGIFCLLLKKIIH